MEKEYKRRRSKVEKFFILILYNITNFFFIKKASAGRVSTSELVNRIYMFIEVYSGIVFFPYQKHFSKRIIRSVLENDGSEITSLFCRQSGKSETVSTTSGGLMIILPQLANMPMFVDDVRLSTFKDGFSIGIFAPTLRQAQLTYNRVRTRMGSKSAQIVMADPEFNLYFNVSNGQTVSLSNGSFVTAISASEGSKIEGESFMLIICDEAQDISNIKLKKSIFPMTSAYNGTIVMVGTSTNFKGYFYEAIETNKNRDLKRPVSERNHYEYDCDIVAKYNPKYAKTVERMKKTLGEKSDEFQMSYKLKWIFERGMFVDIDKFLLDNTENSLDIVLASDDDEMDYVAGIDLGGKSDSTVVTIVEVDWSQPVISEMGYDDEGNEFWYDAYNTYLVNWLELKDMPDYEEQFPIVLDFLENYNLSKVVCDATRESAFAHRLRANMDCPVIPFVFTPKAKSEVYKHFEREINAGRARICASDKVRELPEFDSYVEQLGNLQKGWNGQNMVVSHPKEKNAHDDFVDSHCLAVWGAKDEGEIDSTETVSNKIFRNKNRGNLFFEKVKIANTIKARRR